MIAREWRAAARLSAALLALAPLFGCGAPALAPVSGRVTCDGKPLPLGTILFSPLPASGTDLESPKAAGGGISNGLAVALLLASTLAWIDVRSLSRERRSLPERSDDPMRGAAAN